jgi:predicted nucleotidyltransferase/DNA-binding XRE family transcriptional regulator
MNKFGAKIKELRLKMGLLQRQIAAKLEVDSAMLSKIEKGERNAKEDQVVLLSAILGIKKEELLSLWLADKVYDLVGTKDNAIAAIKIAEEEIGYRSKNNPVISTLKQLIRNVLEKDKRIKKGWLFGSYSRHDSTSKSDIDIMIEIDDYTTFSLFDLFGIQHDLETLVQRKIDLVLKGDMKPFAWTTAKKDLKLIYERQ